MSLEYGFDVEGDLLVVTTRGYDDDISEAVAYGEAILRCCLENNCSRILMDETEVTAVLDKIGQYQMVQRLLEQVPSQLSIAIVASPAHYEETSFGTMVAENRGIHVKLFTSMKLAKEWLLEQA